MKRFRFALLLTSVLAPATALAEEPPMHTVLTRLDGDYVSRNVELNELDGTPVIVTQVLRLLDDGSFEYDPSLQSEATRQFDARQCEPGTLPSESVSIWGGEHMVHGFSCHISWPISEFGEL